MDDIVAALRTRHNEQRDFEDPKLAELDAEGYDQYGWRRRLQPSEWRLLRPHTRPHDTDIGDAALLQDTLNAAGDERPQRLISEKPHLLTATFLQGGHGRYARPQVRLGAEYVPDFLLADTSSMGIFWMLVELESPQERLYLKSGQWAAKARQAIHQVQTWRQWLSENIDYARKPPPAGLGLVDIETAPEGLILIGRRSASDPNHNWLRKNLLTQERIRIHTYDELVDRVRLAERPE